MHMHSKQHLPNSCTWAVWLRQGPGPHGGVAKSAFLPQTCAHRYVCAAACRPDPETEGCGSPLLVLSQDLAIRDELDGGEWKFCEWTPPGPRTVRLLPAVKYRRGLPLTATISSWRAPGTYNWKGESLPREGRREPKCPSTSERGAVAACGQACLRVHRHVEPWGPYAPTHLARRDLPLGPSPSCPPHGREPAACWPEPPHALTGACIPQHASPHLIILISISAKTFFVSWPG